MLQNILILLRPHQYIKNLFIFGPLFFSGLLLNHTLLTETAMAFVIFSLAASSIYILNDIMDVNEDRAHPTKCKRPLASGAISIKIAWVLFTFLFVIAFSSALLLSKNFSIILMIYVVMNIAYSLKLKHIAIIDITVIAIGFVLRILAGAAIIANIPSVWIVLVTFLLAIFLALAKRRDDVLLAQEGKQTRKNIDGYNLEFVNATMILMAGVVIVGYIMYTVSPEITQRLHSNNLYLTVLFVIVGIMRYMQIAFVENNSGSPTKIVLKDRFLQLTLIAWAAAFTLIIYS